MAAHSSERAEYNQSLMLFNNIPNHHLSKFHHENLKAYQYLLQLLAPHDSNTSTPVAESKSDVTSV
jgi:hypothetical protein